MINLQRMVIRSKALRWGLLISALVVAIIIAVQLFWLQKVYLFEEKQFSTNVSKSIKGLYEDLNLMGEHSIEKLIEISDNDFYLAKIDEAPPIDSIRNTLSYELADFGVFTDCNIAVYDAQTKKYSGERYIDLPDTYHSNSDNISIPVFKRNYSYLILFFPHRGQYILKEMYFWIISSGILLLVLIGFSGSIFYLYRQKFLNETQKDFVNNFTHEFKTPLAVIKIAADVLQQPSIIQKPDKFTKYAGIITEQTDYMQRQVQRLLEIAYTDRKTLPLVLEQFDANQLIQKAINDLQPLILEKSVQLTTSFTQNNAVIKADKNHLLLVIINLIENAIKYSQQPVIKISTFAEDLHLIVKVEDNGMGINSEHYKKIFDRFYRVTDGEIHTTKGFGLGLNFVKKIVDAHNGKIEVESKRGEGSTFTIKIPKNL
ncbi:sensor histidine kinase [Ferruginibacter albus]|uniref:sensor histidine kinase n=1 Tax=Ferruginibacter albus TaxID=2875540 RepID=UPI001CC338AE|nr:HAMP domain-containing sensor histidine kinase [Ferruginibacter albus]UAY51794.1 HAMP domain-containing histidine kinase [Ferruginibacter albus]